MFLLMLFIHYVYGLSNQSIALCRLAESVPRLQNLGWKNCDSMTDAAPLSSFIGLTVNSGRVSISLSSRTPVLSGTIPTEIGLLRQLYQLILGVGSLSGTIPTQLAQTSLQTISISRNQISGTLPLEVLQMPTLSSVSLFDNPLSGSLPFDLFKDYISSVQISGTNIGGLIPDLGIGSPYSFRAGNNSFTGWANQTIPLQSRLSTLNEEDRTRYYGKFDYILCTIPDPHNVNPFFELLKPNGGTMHILGNFNDFPGFTGKKSFFMGKQFTGSNISGVKDTQDRYRIE